MNLQNIPSHATDIRHMFRATASRKESVPCVYDEGSDEIRVTLSKFDSVYREDGTLSKIYKLEEGDTVLLQQGTIKVPKILKSRTYDSASCNCDLVFS